MKRDKIVRGAVKGAGAVAGQLAGGNTGTGRSDVWPDRFDIVMTKV